MWVASLLRKLKSGSPCTSRDRVFFRKQLARWSRCRHLRLEVEPLEQRTLLSVQFTAGPYQTPAKRPDVPLGTISDAPYSFKEPMLAVNSTEPGNIAVSSDSGLRISTDAGATFGSSVVFEPPPGSNNLEGGDTDVQFDGQGRLFWSNVVGGKFISVNQIDPATGANITSTLVSTPPARSGDDKPFMAIDTHPSSPFFNNIYIVWTRFLPGLLLDVYFARSTDQGLTWSPPLQLSDDSVEGVVWPSAVSVAPNGDVYVAYHSQAGFLGQIDFSNPDGITGQTFVLRSTDGGLSFAQKNLAFGLLPGCLPARSWAARTMMYWSGEPRLTT